MLRIPKSLLLFSAAIYTLAAQSSSEPKATLPGHVISALANVTGDRDDLIAPLFLQPMNGHRGV